jgi:hypothetical protein
MTKVISIASINLHPDKCDGVPVSIGNACFKLHQMFSPVCVFELVWVYMLRSVLFMDQ